VALEYYRDPSRDELLKVVPVSELLEAYSAFERGTSKFDVELHVRTVHRVYKLHAETHEDMARFLRAFTQAQKLAKASPGGSSKILAAAAAATSHDDGGAGHTGRDTPPLPATMEEEGESVAEGWTDAVSTPQEVTDAVIKRTAELFRTGHNEAMARATAQAEEEGDPSLAAQLEDDSHVANLLAVSTDVINEMLVAADDFRYSEPPRLPFFERCIKEFHVQLYANLAHLLADVSALQPMDALQLLAWLQEYRERLIASEAPPTDPPLDVVQNQLIAYPRGASHPRAISSDLERPRVAVPHAHVRSRRRVDRAYAAQSRLTWEQLCLNLHTADIEALVRGQVDGGIDGEMPGSMAPYDLLRMLNEPFAPLVSLQVPALTNALVGVCADVLTYYASLQRMFITSVGNELLERTLGGGGVSSLPMPATPFLAAGAVCSVLNNAERTIEMVTQIGTHVDREADDGPQEEVSDFSERSERDRTASQAPLPRGDVLADDALSKASRELGSLTPPCVAVLAGLVVYTPLADNLPRGAATPKEVRRPTCHGRQRPVCRHQAAHRRRTQRRRAHRASLAAPSVRALLTDVPLCVCVGVGMGVCLCVCVRSCSRSSRRAASSRRCSACSPTCACSRARHCRSSRPNSTAACSSCSSPIRSRRCSRARLLSSSRRRLPSGRRR
jgi:hypothetical protein